MKKGELSRSMSIVIGIFIGLVIVVAAGSIGGKFVKILFPSDDKIKLENSLTDLQESINNLGLEQTKEGILFYNMDKELYLVTFNKDSDINECFRIPCIALCFDRSCENLWYYREINDNLVFETKGVVAELEKAEEDFFLLDIANVENKISIVPSYQ